MQTRMMRARRVRFLFGTLALMLCAALAAGGYAAAAPGAGEVTPSWAVEPIPCPIEITPTLAGRLACARLRVPENRAVAGGRQIRLVFAVVQPAQRVPNRKPLLFIMGGNGSGMKTLKRNARFTEFLSQGHTVIIADHRGSAPWGDPDMSCPRYEEGLDAVNENADPGEVEACRKHLEERLDVNAYGPYEAALDLRDLRRALGIEQWNVYGVSYGTTIGERLVAVDGDAIAALVLDGMSGVDFNSFSEAFLLDPLIDLFDECAASAVCSRAFPQFERQLGAVTRQLQRRPQRVGGQRVSNVEYLTQIRVAMEDPERRGRIPLAVARSAQGDFSVWQQLVAADAGGPSRKDPALTWPASICRDEYPRRALPERLRPPRRELPASIRSGSTLGVAALWDWGRFCPRLGFRASADETMAVPVSDVPTLFLSGQLDLTTPPFEVDASMRRLRNSQHVVFPLLGHWVLLRDLECAGAIVGNFFDNPSARVDARCVAAMPKTAWAER